MVAWRRFSSMFQLDPASEGSGFKQCDISMTKSFWNTQKLGELISNSCSDQNLTSVLLSLFGSTAEDVLTQAQAGLCLRCYVSEPILRACQKLDSLFGTCSFTYRDLLPFVLDDDGKTLIALSLDRKTQMAISPSGEASALSYPVFSVRILQTYKSDRASSMSLDNWTYLQTRQHPELKSFLAEFGFKLLTDWALLNRTRSRQLEQLSVRDRHLVEAFHAVYRRDRRQQSVGI